MGRGVGIPEAGLRTNSVRENAVWTASIPFFGGEQRGNAARNVGSGSRGWHDDNYSSESQGLLPKPFVAAPIADRAPF
jgi:hypothetical protein